MKRILRNIICDLIIVSITVLFVPTLTSHHGVLAEAQSFENLNANLDDGTELTFPYTTTFRISAYYSPLPCQQKYVTGSYAGDIRLNGGGVRGADGTPVFPGMIAAPRTYPFGTKMYIPDVGIVSVHDRGGAILASNGVEGVYDRLDIWMGYGDIGLKRALNWGKRNVPVTVYGQNEDIIEHISLADYSEEEKYNSDCSATPITLTEAKVMLDKPIIKPEVEFESSRLIPENLSLGSNGDSVLSLQKELTKLNFYKVPPTNVYDETTKHAVYKFQQSQNLVGNELSQGAGVFGTKTRDRLNEIIATRNYMDALVASATLEYKNENPEAFLASQTKVQSDGFAFSDGFIAEDGTSAIVTNNLLAGEINVGDVSDDVKVLQQFLKEKGYFRSALFTNYYGNLTRKAVLEFQLANGIIKSETDLGAGRVGPSTLKYINEVS